MQNKSVVKNDFVQTIPQMILDYNKAADKSASIVALQLLNFCANGSPNESVKPPIESGYLRGSGSVFVNGKFISATPAVNGEGDPIRSLTASSYPYNFVIDITYNTEYAARLHETDWTPGGVIPSRAKENNPAITQNVGNKWIEKHLKADGQDLLDLFGSRVKKYFFNKNKKYITKG